MILRGLGAGARGCLLLLLRFAAVVLLSLLPMGAAAADSTATPWAGGSKAQVEDSQGTRESGFPESSVTVHGEDRAEHVSSTGVTSREAVSSITVSSAQSVHRATTALFGRVRQFQREIVARRAAAIDSAATVLRMDDARRQRKNEQRPMQSLRTPRKTKQKKQASSHESQEKKKKKKKKKKRTKPKRIDPNLLMAKPVSLPETINLAFLSGLSLNFLPYDVQHQARLHITCVDGLKGRGAHAALPTCPHFTPCHAATVTESTVPGIKAGTSLADTGLGIEPGALAACSSGYADGPPRWPQPPLNCKTWYTMSKDHKDELLKEANSAGVLASKPELGCAQSKDFEPIWPVTYSVFQLQRIYISSRGIIFNRSTIFLRGGCQDRVGHHNDKMLFPKASIKVKTVPAVMNWAYQFSTNFYHCLADAFPVFFQMAPILAEHKDLPLLGVYNQFRSCALKLEPLLGVPVASAPRYEMDPDDIFYAATAYQPTYQTCFGHSKALWTRLRSRHLLHPSGLPLFNPDWSRRNVAAVPLTPQQMMSYPPDWVVILVRRPGTRRAIRNIQQIEDLLTEIFTPERVMIFKDQHNILEARGLFRRARLLVASHGAAMSNMIFMPQGANVIEIRPTLWEMRCLHALALACSLRYHLIFGNGTGHGVTDVDVHELKRVVRDIQQELLAEA